MSASPTIKECQECGALGSQAHAGDCKTWRKVDAAGERSAARTTHQETGGPARVAHVATPAAQLRGDAARAVLRGLSLAGARVVQRARSPHGSDCPCDAAHLDGPIGQCRCVRVMRVRVPSAGDWLLVFGDVQEGGAMRLQGPYRPDAPLTYGGGFWCRVTV